MIVRNHLDPARDRDQNANSWAQCLYYLLDSDQLSRTEKEWLLGGSARQILSWAN